MVNQIYFFAPGCSNVSCDDTSLFEGAVTAAKQAQVAILFMGISVALESEGNDRVNITLPGYQEDLIQTIQFTSTPVIVVLINGAAVSSVIVQSTVPASLEAFYPGMEAGHAILDVILGNVNPGARLPYTVYESISQILPITNYSMSDGNGRTYRYFTGQSLYPFGYGRSYTTFSYSNLIITPNSIAPCSNIQISVTVTNTGSVYGTEVIQVYLQNTNANYELPQIQLGGFERVGLNPNQSTTVNFTIVPQQMAAVDTENYTYVIAPVAVFNVFVGGGQPNQIARVTTSNILSSSFTITGSTTVPLSQC